LLSRSLTTTSLLGYLLFLCFGRFSLFSSLNIPTTIIFLHQPQQPAQSIEDFFQKQIDEEIASISIQQLIPFTTTPSTITIKTSDEAADK
jgi:hypothetical protein